MGALLLQHTVSVRDIFNDIIDSPLTDEVASVAKNMLAHVIGIEKSEDTFGDLNQKISLLLLHILFK